MAQPGPRDRLTAIDSILADLGIGTPVRAVQDEAESAADKIRDEAEMYGPAIKGFGKNALMVGKEMMAPIADDISSAGGALRDTGKAVVQQNADLYRPMAEGAMDMGRQVMGSNMMAGPRGAGEAVMKLLKMLGIGGGEDYGGPDEGRRGDVMRMMMNEKLQGR